MDISRLDSVFAPGKAGMPALRQSGIARLWGKNIKFTRIPSTTAVLLVLCSLMISGGLLMAADQKKAPISSARVKELQAAIEKLKPLHKKLGPPGTNDWLARFPEPGQTFLEYVQSNPTMPRGKRHVIYVQPLGDFTSTQRKIITLTADFMGRYFNLPVKIKDDLPLSLIPPNARRKHPTWGMDQVLTTYVLDDLLIPRLPGDAAACIAFTTSDLWPGKGWNFVFGQASTSDRVGVWSIYRNGDPEESPETFRLCLLRTMKTATHETGHMFSIAHCIAYQCDMCGSNSREEADRRPIACCPECVAKICYATGADPGQRYKKLAQFCREQGLSSEAEFYEKSIKTLEGR